jgi:eukaryotic-like serine/threonine-protein kinase
MPLGTGRLIAGRYILEELIGRGAMGIVWRAHDQLLDRPVAVKEVLLSPMIGELDDGDPYQRTMDEARNAARLNHPGIVTVYDVVEEEGRPWIVMELIPSITLEQLIASQGPMAELRAARIGSQLLAALSAAHKSGVLHRDVKPGNVLITRDRSGENLPERAVLTDFGISRLESDPRRTLSGLVVGSPGYVAPERLGGDDATPASDLWSLGATLYTAVEGHGPFERQNVLSTQFAIVNEDPPPAPSAGRLAAVIGALLRREPADRPTASEAADMIAQIQQRMERMTAPPTSPDPVMSRRAGTEPDAPRASGPPAPDYELSGTQTLARARPRPSRKSRVRIRVTIPVVLAAIVIGAIVGGVLWSQRTTPASNLRSASASGSAAPTTTAATAAAGLPPVSSAPTVVKAIDQPTSVLPPGYVARMVPATAGRNSRGFGIDTPPGWQPHLIGQQTYRYSPDGGVTYLKIDLSPHVMSGMVAEAEFLAAKDRAEYPGYQLIYGQQKQYIQREDILGTAGALWQFDWVKGATKRRVDVLLFDLGQQSYTITMTARAGSFDANWNNSVLPLVKTMLGTFRSIAYSAGLTGSQYTQGMP